MKAYGQEIVPVPHVRLTISDDSKSFNIGAWRCAGCQYLYFIPILPENEPSFCPNCGKRIGGLKIAVK